MPLEDLRSGDLIFLGQGSSELSKAISGVTQTAEHTSYSHMGMVQVDTNGIWVIHASSQKGVVKELIEQFNLTVNDGLPFVYRLKAEIKADFSQQLQLGNSVIGQPYNSTYIMEDKGFYCSELIYSLFERDSIFKLKPMTFKGDKNTFLPAWIDYYNKLNIPIPEGQPGCNPNGMAAKRRPYLFRKAASLN